MPIVIVAVAAGIEADHLRRLRIVSTVKEQQLDGLRLPREKILKLTPSSSTVAPNGEAEDLKPPVIRQTGPPETSATSRKAMVTEAHDDYRSGMSWNLVRTTQLYYEDDYCGRHSEHEHAIGSL